jgi:hypothetical protein
VSKHFRLNWLPSCAFAIAVTIAAAGNAQTGAEVDVEGYLCQKPIDAEEFQQLASTSPRMSREKALSRFNRAADEPRCDWYERTSMIYKGAVKKQAGEGATRATYLFIGGDGGVFEVLIFEMPEGAETLYSWRRTDDETG